MQTTPIRAKHGAAPDRIAGDRRRDRRYSVPLELSWKLIRRRQVLDAGVGVTLNISSGGILLDADRSLPPGANIELAIAWPILLHDVTRLQLVVQGRVKRCNGRLVAVETAQQEFRTVKASSVCPRGASMGA
jgi:PilZ domain